MKKNMKSSYLYVISIVMLLYACKEETVGMQPMDSVPPGPVSEVTWYSIPGGAVFRYMLPDDEDLLYVKAVYHLNGIETESKASVFADSLVIVGFGDTDEHQISLIAVDRSRNESTPYFETITPGLPDVLSIDNSLYLIADFGGVHAYWKNPNKAEISVNILYKDHNDEYVPLQAFYSSGINGDGVVRGMDTISTNFAVYVQDKWNNQSEKKYYALTPIYEAMFDPNRFAKVELNNDISYFPGYGMENMWDGDDGIDHCYSSSPGTGIWPQSITMDLGIAGKISRVRLYQRVGGLSGSLLFAEGNLREFEIWGCLSVPDISGSWDNWILLMDCVNVKPSGLPFGQLSDEDIEVGFNGEDYNNSPENPPVRYLRILAKRTWSGGSNFQILNIEVYGDYR